MKRLNYLALFFPVIVLVIGLAATCGDYEDAETTTAAAPDVEEIPVTTASQEALAEFRKGQKAQDAGRRQLANARFESATLKDPEFSYAYFNIANTAASAPEFNDNLKLAMEHIEGKSDGERLLVEIFQTFFDNDSEKRMELSRQLVASYPRSPRAWLTLAGMQAVLNRHQEARESSAKALELDPDFFAGHRALWFSYLFNEPKDFAAAERAAQRCLEIAPGEATVHESLGDVYRAMKDLGSALASYDKAAEMDPALSVVHVKRGHVNSFLGNFDEARAAYDLGVAGAKQADQATFANFRAFAHLHQGNPRRALDELGEIVSRAGTMGIPQDQIFGAKIFTLTNQATIALHHDLVDDAERILAARSEVVRANAERVNDPDFSRRQEADNLLWEGRLAARKGDYETAEARAQEHRKLLENDTNPRRFEGYFGLRGLIELSRGNPEQAVEQFRRANLNVMYVKYHLALALVGTGQSEEAKAIFKEVSEWNFNTVGFALVRQDAAERAV